LNVAVVVVIVVVVEKVACVNTDCSENADRSYASNAMVHVCRQKHLAVKEM